MKKLAIGMSGILVLALSSCANRKSLVVYPKLDIDPPVVKVDKKTGEDPMRDMQWNMRKISATSVWGEEEGGMVTEGSRAVSVMIIGTGINYNHPDLQANLAINWREIEQKDPTTGKYENNQDDDGNTLVDDFVGWDFVDEDGWAYDHFGFDTMSAGIIGAVHDNGIGIKGVAKQVSIYPVRYITSNGLSSTPMLIAALRHVLKVKVDVVLLNLLNLEMGERRPELKAVEVALVKSILNQIRQKGIPIVVGSGNAELMISPEMKLINELAAYDNVFVVSSSTRQDRPAELANYNPMMVKTFAPGEGILSTSPSGGWDTASSTQLAAAHVAAALALAISRHGNNKAYDEMFTALKSSEGSQEVAELARWSVGRNRLDVQKFLSSLE